MNNVPRGTGHGSTNIQPPNERGCTPMGEKIVNSKSSIVDSRGHGPLPRLTPRWPALLEAGQIFIDVRPGDGPFRPCLAIGFDELRLIQAAGFEKDHIRAFLRPGKERRAAVRAELAGDLAAAVGDARVPFDLATDDPQVLRPDQDAHRVGPARGFSAVVAVTVAGLARVAGTFIPARPRTDIHPAGSFPYTLLVEPKKEPQCFNSPVKT